SAAARAARRALALHPEDEAEFRALLLLLEEAGDRPGALQAYHDYARRLNTELETEPAAETRRLADAIRERRDAEAAAPPAAQAPSATPAATAAPPATRNLRRPLVLAGVAALGLIALTAAIAFRWNRHRQAPPPVRTLAVFPFTLRGGAPFGYLSDGMVDLLSAKLEGASGFHAIDPRTVLAASAGSDASAAADPAVRARIAKELGAGWYINGDVIEVAGRLQINGALMDLNGGPQPLATASVSGDTTQLFELVDDLAGRMLARLAVGRDTALVHLAAVTTHSLPALRRYLDGERALREGRDAQAAAAFREAATLDTNFALAQYRLALAATWVRTPTAEDPAPWAARAAQHAQRLTPLARDLLSAYRAYKEVDADQAEQLYRTSIESHPDNFEAWFMLGETLFHYNFWRGRTPMEAWTPFQRALALDPTNAHALVHLARLAAAEGKLEELDSLVARYRQHYPEAERMLEMEALQAFTRDDLAQRREVTASARTADEYVKWGLLLDAFCYAQNLDAARELATTANSLTTGSNGAVVLWRYLHELPLSSGQWRNRPGSPPLPRGPDPGDEDAWRLESEALLAAEPLLPLPAVRIAGIRDSIAARRPYTALRPPSLKFEAELGGVMQTYLVGLLSLRLGDSAAAKRSLAELLQIREMPLSAAANQLAHGLRAEMARARGDSRAVLAELDGFYFGMFNGGFRGAAHWGVHERFLKAEALHALGREEEALPWYQSFRGAYDVPFLPLAHYRLAEIHHKLGEGERVAFHVARLRSMWRDADPEFKPLVEQAESWSEQRR
ncbi:MAG TPA: BTAD domain-containing putative transcriptional regulator, partial [Gemmatimonadales bacterium]|nr:BTAD domain-containing putative transcriptional regulator [Gemmatimonadales bacterium]